MITMTFTGPPPKPTALKLLEGNPGRQKLPKNEPQPTELPTLDPPPKVSDDAKSGLALPPSPTGSARSSSPMWRSSRGTAQT
jgi:hypothetical protein